MQYNIVSYMLEIMALNSSNESGIRDKVHTVPSSYSSRVKRVFISIIQCGKLVKWCTIS